MPAKGFRVWAPTVSMLLVSLISYIDRNTLALLAPTILRESGLSAEEYGWIISAFSAAYMLGNPLWGRGLDRFGVRWGMLAAVLFWTCASTAHAFVAGFLGFAVARACLGFGEGATFPGGLRTAVQTLPSHLRSRGIAIAYSGGSLGAIVTPLIVTPVYQLVGWRGAFLFTGAIGCAWLVWWWNVSRRDDLRHAPQREAPAPAEALRWSDMRLWSFMASYALGGLPLAFVIYHAPLYFSRALEKGQVEIGAVLWIPPVGWELGYFVWGWAADRMLRGAKDPVSVYRKLTAVAFVLMLPLMLTPRVESFGGVLALLFLAMFVAGGNVISTIGYATNTISTAHAGLIAGLGAGAWSAVVALTMPYFGRMIDQRHFDQAFLLATVVPLSGFAFWMWVNRPRASVEAANEALAE